MFAKTVKVMLIVAMLSTVLGSGLALASDTGWTELNPGEEHWYTIQYRGHHEFPQAKGEDEEEPDPVFVASQVEIRLDAEPDGGACFKVITPDQVRAWEAGEDLDSCGCGTENEYDAADLSWAGCFAVPGDYYVVVGYSGDGVNPVRYTLDVSGEDVTVNAPVPAEDESVSEVATAMEAAEPDFGAGTGPGNAMTPSNDWTLLPVGETLWYAFDYRGHHEFPEAKDEDKEAPDPVFVASEVRVSLDSEPDGGASFGIWTEEQVRLWAAGEEFEPVGQGTENEYSPGDISWSGSFAGPGHYYIVVKHEGSEPTYFQLNVGGQDID